MYFVTLQSSRKHDNYWSAQDDNLCGGLWKKMCTFENNPPFYMSAVGQPWVSGRSPRSAAVVCGSVGPCGSVNSRRTPAATLKQIQIRCEHTVVVFTDVDLQNSCKSSH